MMHSHRIRSLWEIMLQFPAGELLTAVSALGNFAHTTLQGNGIAVPLQNHRWLVGAAELAERVCREHNLSASQVSAAQLVVVLRDESKPVIDRHGEDIMEWSQFSTSRIKHFSSELLGRVKDELSNRLILEISPKMRDKFDPQEPLFGVTVADRFPATAYDVEEAGKCLALGRSTACVFHLMRAAEGAAAVVSTELERKIQDDNGEPLTFGGLFRQISDAIECMPRGAKKDEWLKLKGFMSSINRGSRTKVAHPGNNYTEQQAERIFEATKSFMEEAEELLRARSPQNAI